MQTFSPNMLKTFEECPKKYYFRYIEKISVPQKASHFEKGKKIHALAHYYLRGDDISKLENALTKEELQTWELLKNNEYLKKTYVNSEYNLSCLVKDFWIGGRLDAVMKDFICHSEQRIDLRVSESLCYYILDYKTGAIPKNPQDDFQTMVYLLALNSYLAKFYGEKPNAYTLQFIYVDLKNNINHTINFDDQIKNQYENAISQICTKITETKNYTCEKSKKCDYCEFNKICN